MKHLKLLCLYWLLAVTIFTANAQTQPPALPDVKQWIGEKFPPHPSNYTEKDSAAYSEHKTKQYIRVALLNNALTASDVVILQKLDAFATKKDVKPNLVLDAVNLPKSKIGYRYSLGVQGAGDCVIKNEVKASVEKGLLPKSVLIYQIKQNKDKYLVSAAWQVDRERHKIIPVPVSKLYCGYQQLFDND